MTTPRVGVGRVGVEVPCPRCGTLELIAVQLSGVLTTPTDDAPTLRVRARSRPLEHQCGVVVATLLDELRTADREE